MGIWKGEISLENLTVNTEALRKLDLPIVRAHTPIPTNAHTNAEGRGETPPHTLTRAHTRTRTRARAHTDTHTRAPARPHTRPQTIHHGTVKKLNVKIPWTALERSPVQISIDGVYLLVCGGIF